MRRYRFTVTRPDLPPYDLVVELQDDAAAGLHAFFLAQWERERLGSCRAREVSVTWRRVPELQTRAPFPTGATGDRVQTASDAALPTPHTL